MSNRLSGNSSLAYLGTNAANPPNIFRNRKRAPTANDYSNFSIGDIWIYENQIANTQIVYMLVSLAGSVATWQEFNVGTSTFQSLEGN